jgi:hypothetical protein|tara:strand:+ start:29108 stop:29752 length:645 start_codon:yes stop_codon:yes gene_type:complete
MKNVICLTLVFFGFGIVQAQQIDNRFRVQIYTGGPSLLKSAVNVSQKWQDEVTYSGVPLIGGVFDVRVKDWLSVGVDASFRSGNLEFDVMDSTLYTQIEEKWDIRLDEYVDPFGHYELKLPRTRIMFNFNIHALPVNSRSDLYFGFGIGYNNLKPRLTLNGNEIPYFKSIGKISMPMAYRTSVGYSYNFSEHFGAFAEVGIGGPIVSGGLNVKF